MLGVSVAAFREGKVLLTKREDFQVWCLPGGYVEAGESLAEAAIREMLEETGLQVRITRLVGLYSRPRWDHGDYHIAVFAGEVIGGEAHPQPEEVVEMAFFGPEDVPQELLVGHRQRILDAFAGVGGSVVRSEHAAAPFGRSMTRQELYALRDQSGLPRHVFYMQHIDCLDSDGSTLEVGPDT